MRFIKGFAEFWYDFIIGDGWKIAGARRNRLHAGRDRRPSAFSSLCR